MEARASGQDLTYSISGIHFLLANGTFLTWKCLIMVCLANLDSSYTSICARDLSSYCACAYLFSGAERC